MIENRSAIRPQSESWLQTFGRRWSRLTGASWDELQTRAIQEIRKRGDFFRCKLALPLVEKQERPECGSGNFFFSRAQAAELSEFLKNNFPNAAQSTIHNAERILAHRFDLLGYQDLDYGHEIDWHLDAVSGKRAPLRPWYKLDFLDYDLVGDVKVTWELNRHQHLVELAKARLYSGDKRYADEVVAQWRHWFAHNPYLLGVNWASSLEVAFRALSWLWVKHLLAGDPSIDPQFWSELDGALAISGRHIERYLSTYFSPNTHLLGEGVGLFFLGTLTGSRRAATWRRVGWQIVLNEALRQVQPDGMHFEQSTYYHVYALDFFLHARMLAAANGMRVPPQLDEAIGKMLSALCVLSHQGTPPRFGDDDGGRLFDGRRNRPEHLLDPLSTGAALYRRGDCKAAAPSLVEETVWLLGIRGAQAFQDVVPEPAEARLAALKASGLMVMTDHWANAQLSFDAGPQGACGGGHSHADALSIQLSARGKEVLTDPGTAVYVSAGDERAYFRGTGAHNTVQVDGADQSVAQGPFPWLWTAPVRLENCTAGNDFTLLAACHDGYRRLNEPVTHRRTIFHRHGRFWLIFDLIDGVGEHEVGIRWRLAPGLRWNQAGETMFADPNGAAVAVIPVAGHGWNAIASVARYSSVYGRIEQADVLSYSIRARPPITFASILRCTARADQDWGAFTEMPSEAESGVSVYRYEVSGQTHLMVLALQHHAWQWRALASDAEFLYYGIENSGCESIACCGASYLSVSGVDVFRNARAAPRWEWSSVADGLSAGVPLNSLANTTILAVLRELAAGKQIGAHR